VRKKGEFPQIGIVTSSTATHAKVYFPLWETESGELESSLGWLETGREVVVVFPAGDEANGYIASVLPSIFPQRGIYQGGNKVEIQEWKKTITCESWVGSIVPGREVLVTFINGNSEKGIITHVKPGGGAE
jgi:hypothetical protein